MRMLRRFWRMSSSERWLFLEAYARIVGVDIELRRHGIWRCASQTAGFDHGARSVAAADQVARARVLSRWVEAAARHHVIRARCLHRSLALHRWLCALGLPSQLRIGVMKDGSELRAHAWVDVWGETVNDDPSAVAGFRPLLSLGAQPVGQVAAARELVVQGAAATRIQAVRWQ